jgi:hypothetical protein
LFVAHRDEIAIIIEVDELLARAVILLTSEVGSLVIAVEVHLERLAAYIFSFE